MSWDTATLQFHCLAGGAGWEADSDYTVDPTRPEMPDSFLPKKAETGQVFNEIWFMMVGGLEYLS
jgi:hypothetical protein